MKLRYYLLSKYQRIKNLCLISITNQVWSRMIRISLPRYVIYLSILLYYYFYCFLLIYILLFNKFNLSFAKYRNTCDKKNPSVSHLVIQTKINSQNQVLFFLRLAEASNFSKQRFIETEREREEERDIKEDWSTRIFFKRRG